MHKNQLSWFYEALEGKKGKWKKELQKTFGSNWENLSMCWVFDIRDLLLIFFGVIMISWLFLEAITDVGLNCHDIYYSLLNGSEKGKQMIQTWQNVNCWI